MNEIFIFILRPIDVYIRVSRNEARPDKCDSRYRMNATPGKISQARLFDLISRLIVFGMSSTRRVLSSLFCCLTAGTLPVYIFGNYNVDDEVERR